MKNILPVGIALVIGVYQGIHFFDEGDRDE